MNNQTDYEHIISEPTVKQDSDDDDEDKEHLKRLEKRITGILETGQVCVTEEQVLKHQANNNQ